MDALVDDPKVPFGEILSSTSLSPKTVRKHLNLLLEKKTISIDPQTHYTLEPPIKHVLSRAGSLADVITKTRALERAHGVKSVTITLNREVLVSTDFRHSLIRDEISKLKKVRNGLGQPTI
jgi:DNA-binding IclR family transcriptional regulator